MSLFTKKKPPILGIDISSTSVKVVELSSNNGQFKVEHCAVEPLPENAVVEKNITEVEPVGEAVRKAIKKSGSKAKFCAMAVPSSAVITKTITMPANLSETDLEGQIEIEADQYIPYAIEEVNLDFEIIGPTPKNPETNDVLLVASRSENVEIRQSVAQIAGITPKIIDIEPYTIENTFHDLIQEKSLDGSEDEKVIAVIDIGATMTSINVLEQGKLNYTRENPFGGKQLTEEIMRRYGLSYEEAGLAKREGGLPDNYIPEVLEPFKENIAQQVHRFLQFYFSSGSYQSIDQIILAGGCASIPGVDELIENKLESPAMVANPFARMSLASRINPQRLTNDAPSMLIACGLALRGFG